MIVCGDIGNRREIGHKEDQGVFSIMDGSESLMAKFSRLKVSESVISPGSSKVKERRRRRKGFVFSALGKSSVP